MQSMNLFVLALWLFLHQVVANSTPPPRGRYPPPPRKNNNNSTSNALQQVNLRIEGANNTIFEGPVRSRGHIVSTISGGSNPCDGTNNNASSTPGNTPTATLDTAAQKANFTWDGTYGAFDDYFITRIGPDAQTSDKFWGILVNYQLTPVGGCQFKTQKDDDILFAYDASNAKYFLKLDGRKVARTGQRFTLKVTDGKNGTAVPNAFILPSSGQPSTTDERGNADFVFSKPGKYSFKASREDSIRSNRFIVSVT